MLRLLREANDLIDTITQIEIKFKNITPAMFLRIKMIKLVFKNKKNKTYHIGLIEMFLYSLLLL